MYIPEFNRIEDGAVALAFMKANPFAILVSATESGPFATHLPLLVCEQAGQLVLSGHLAKANPHWKAAPQGLESLVIFHGPHAYISPSLYEIAQSVPTWNYAAVHVYGPVQWFSDEERLMTTLHEMIETFEARYMDQWSGLSDSYRRGMMQHIVGFEITATRWEAKFKLSQNRTKTEQAQIIDSLKESADSNISGIAKMMRDQGLGLIR